MNLMNEEKHYNTLSAYYKYKYHKKVAKISLNANFTCPNKDGTKGYGGCTYCSKLGSGDFAGDKEKSLKEQFLDVKNIIEKKWHDILYIPYLQANSNTYAPLENLKKIYEEAINLDSKVVMLSIATRADCINDEVVSYLAALNKKTPIQVELGLQTIHETTAKLINRCHTLNEFEEAVIKLRKYNIEVVVHIINGLPFETKEMMLDTVKYLNKLDIQGIKIHSLLILNNTKMAQEFRQSPWHILTLEEYVDITILQLRHLRDDIIIHRLAADGVIDDLIEPKWTIKKLVVMNEIDKKMRLLNAFQGDLYTHSLTNIE